MDYLNNYGLHPFWPIANTWHYGDAVFIVEPAYWIAAAPLWFGLRTLASRIALGVPLVLAIVALAVVHASSSVPIVAALVVAGMLAFGRWRPGATAAAASALMTVAVTAAFVIGGARAASEVERAARRDFPGEQLLDHVLTPAPSMPACWDVLLLQRADSTYIARRGRVVLAPAADDMRCPLVFGGGEGSAPWETLPESTGRVRWLQELRFPVERLAAAVKGHCEAEALMQFARAPFVIAAGTGWLVGDLRFDREAGPGFAEVEVGAAEPRCPSPAPWLPPRGDLLR
jgi:inner membrane protein